MKPHVTLGAEITLGGKTPPSEFRLFKAGQNDTLKGVYLFDARAAQLVMQHATARGGIDYAIDLEHLSLDPDARAYDPDARGWFGLQLRRGELWAVNVRWSPDGARRLSEGTQRYISPAFVADADRRVVEIVNVALVAMPATQGSPALIAASRGAPAPMFTKQTTRRPFVTLAAEAGNSGRFAAVRAATDKLEEALAQLDGAADPDVPIALDAANAALQEVVAALALYKVAPEAMSLNVSTAYGPWLLTANQVRECLRASVKPSVLAERLAKSAHDRKPRVA